MSDFDRNVAARGFGAARTGSRDRCRACAPTCSASTTTWPLGVALTGVVALVAFRCAVHQRPTSGRSSALTSFGRGRSSAAADDHPVMLAHAWHGALPELPHRHAAGDLDRAGRCSCVYAALLGLIAVVGVPELHRRARSPACSSSRRRRSAR